MASFFKTNFKPLHLKMLFAMFGQNWTSHVVLLNVKIGAVVLEKMKTTKKNTDRQTEDGQQAIREVYLKFQLR